MSRPRIVQQHVFGEAQTTSFGFSSALPDSASTNNNAPVSMPESFLEKPDPVEQIEQGEITPVPTLEQRRSSAPQTEWDPTRYVVESDSNTLFTCVDNLLRLSRGQKPQTFPRSNMSCLKTPAFSNPLSRIQNRRRACITTYQKNEHRPPQGRSLSFLGKNTKLLQHECLLMRNLRHLNLGL